VVGVLAADTSLDLCVGPRAARMRAWQARLEKSRKRRQYGLSKYQLFRSLFELADIW